jgi:hypothetical protein
VAERGVGGVAESRLVMPPFSLRFRLGRLPPFTSFLARERAYRRPQALQSSFLPLGPFLHSGLVVALHEEHIGIPAGLLLPTFPVDGLAPSLLDPGLTRLRGGGTTSLPGGRPSPTPGLGPEAEFVDPDVAPYMYPGESGRWV